MDERFTPDAARKLIRTALAAGAVTFSRHCLEQLDARDLDRFLCLDVLSGGVVEEPEMERGTWRYRVRAGSVAVVVAFRPGPAVVVVTAWRIG